MPRRRFPQPFTFRQLRGRIFRGQLPSYVALDGDISGLQEQITDIDGRTDDGILIKSVDDLSGYLAGDEYVLPGEKVVLMPRVLDIGDKALRLSAGTFLRSDAFTSVVSSNANGVVRASNVGGNVILREFNVVATGGAAFVLEGGIEHQLNMFFVGMFGAKAAIVTGFDVQAFKDCFIDAADGVTCMGVSNKIFFSQCPFYGITGSAITFGSTLDAGFVDITTSYFKFDGPGIGVKAEQGYSVDRGLLRGSARMGSAVMLDGLSESDLHWWMKENQAIPNSRIAGALWLDESVETVVSAVDTPVKAEGITLPADLNQRIDMGDGNGTAINNRLTYLDSEPALLDIDASLSVDSGNNETLEFYIAKNGVVLPQSKTRVRIGSGQDERSIALATLAEAKKGDYFEVWGENTTSAANFELLTLSLNVKG